MRLAVFLLLALVAVSGDGDDTVCTNPIDVILVLDHSDSITDEDWSQVISFSLGLVDSFDIKPETASFGVVQFAAISNLTMCLSSNKCSIERGLRVNPPLGITTDVLSGLERAEAEFNLHSPSDKERIIVLVTDGADNTNTMDELRAVADRIKNTTKIYCVGVKTDSTDTKKQEETFDAISSVPHSQYIIYVDDGFAGLQEKFENIVSKECEVSNSVNCPFGLLLLVIIFAIYAINLEPLGIKTPDKVTGVDRYHLSGIGTFLVAFVLIIAMVLAQKANTQETLCVFIVIFLILTIGLIGYAGYILWDAYRKRKEHFGISRAGMKTLEYGDSTISGMTAFRKEGTKKTTVDRGMFSVDVDLD